MQLAKCPKCGKIFPNTLRECPGCGYSPFRRQGEQPQAQPMPQAQHGQQSPAAPPQEPAPPAQPTPAPAPTPEKKPADKAAKKKRARVIRIALFGLLAAGVIGMLFVPSFRGWITGKDPQCIRGDHEWIEATCTEPRTCARCGKTDGEALGHEYEDNICTRCGEYEKPYTFSDLSSQRSGRSVIFSGSIRNYTDEPAKDLQFRLELYDRNKHFVESEMFTLFEQEELPALSAKQWSFTFDDSDLSWKYWRVAVIDPTLAE